jgi:hypothetical protein
MEPGFVVDHTYGAVARSEWASGESTYSQWSGMKMKGRQRYNVATYRCMRCGLLESYAQDLAEEDSA